MRHLLGTRCLSSAGLAIGSGDATKLKIANTVTFMIDGVIYTKTTAEIVFTDVTVQPISTTCYYLLSLDSGGNGVITTGTANALPDPPAGFCPVGYVKVVTDGTGTFVPATDDLSDAAVTDTYVNIGVLPTTLV
jgi:hypothetical protein